MSPLQDGGACDTVQNSVQPRNPHQEPAPRGKRDRLLPAEERTFGGVAAHHQPRPAELPKPLEDGFEPRPRSPGNPSYRAGE